MKALVAVASRHGSTHEIAEAIAGELRAAGIETDLREVTELSSIDGYDAVVLGSAVYIGNWLSPARDFAERQRERLLERPVWFFSSGPIGAEDPQPHGDPEGVRDLVEAVKPRGHRVFEGRLDPHLLGLRERLVAKAVHAPEGDFRDWNAVRGWAQTIAAELKALPERAPSATD